MDVFSPMCDPWLDECYIRIIEIWSKESKTFMTFFFTEAFSFSVMLKGNVCSVVVTYISTQKLLPALNNWITQYA